jgi:phage tail-like protein
MTPFSNLQYLLDHLPARYRVADEEQEYFLQRFLTYFCQELDGFDEHLDTYHEKINPDTTPDEFLEWQLYSKFGWAWFPPWFTEARKREFYRNIAKHYARRGTAEGIRLLLAAFGVTAYVQAQPLVWGEWAWGEPLVSITGPLGLSVSILPRVDAAAEDMSFWGAFVWGESPLATPAAQLQQVDVNALLRWSQPLATVVMVESLQFIAPPSESSPGYPNYGEVNYGE